MVKNAILKGDLDFFNKKIDPSLLIDEVTPLTYALSFAPEENYYKLIKKLISKNRINLNHIESDGTIPFMYLATTNKIPVEQLLELVDFFMDYGFKAHLFTDLFVPYLIGKGCVSPVLYLYDKYKPDDLLEEIYKDDIWDAVKREGTQTAFNLYKKVINNE